MNRTRIYVYAQHCVLAGQAITSDLAESRGLIERDARGRIIRESDDLIHLRKRDAREWAKRAGFMARAGRAALAAFA